MIKSFLSLIFLAGLLVLSVVASPVEQVSTGTEGYPWWNDRVFYEVFVRAFEDSDGDGNGDLPGLISKLDYLNDGDSATDSDLGITGLWLMPIAEGDTYHGYHVTDFETIEADYGANEDFKTLVNEAHARGIAVIIDLVINHTSNQHPWFIDAQTPGSAHDSWYRWSPTHPGYLGPWGQQVWHEAGGRYYYGVFNGLIPDLNLRNPAVTQAVYSMADFWLTEMNVDGFRLDAIKHLVEDGQKQENTPGTLTWLVKWNEHIKAVKPDVFTVGEVQSSPAVTSLYVPEGVDTTFEFDFASAIASSVNQGNSDSLRSGQTQLLDRFEPGQYSAFLSNHDFNRVMSVLNGDFGKAKVAASVLLTQPGVPFLYYGEEIGMTGLKPDECLRTRFQWDATLRTSPFLEGKNCETSEAAINVANQQNDPDSLLSHYRTLIHLRNDHPALRVGDFTFVESVSDAVYSFMRHNEDETLLVIINLSDEAVRDYELTVASALNSVGDATLVLGQGDLAQPSSSAHGGFENYLPLGELPPYSTTIIELSRADAS